MTRKQICLRDFIIEGAVFKLNAAAKTDVLREIAEKAAALGWLADKEKSTTLFHQLHKREQLGSTGIIPHIAIPHCKSDVIEQDMILLVGFSPDGVSFDSQDGKPVKLLFTVITRKDMTTMHLGALAAISRMISRHGLSARIDDYMDREQLQQIIDECEYEI